MTTDAVVACKMLDVATKKEEESASQKREATLRWCDAVKTGFEPARENPNDVKSTCWDVFLSNEIRVIRLNHSATSLPLIQLLDGLAL